MQIIPIETSKQAAKNEHWQEVSFGNLMQRLVYTREELSVSLNNALKLHAQACQYHGTLWGKLMQALHLATDPDWIEVDGTRLMQLFELTNTKPPIPLSAAKRYHAEIVGLRAMIKSLDNLNK